MADGKGKFSPDFFDGEVLSVDLSGDLSEADREKLREMFLAQLPSATVELNGTYDASSGATELLFSREANPDELKEGTKKILVEEGLLQPEDERELEEVASRVVRYCLFGDPGESKNG